MSEGIPTIGGIATRGETYSKLLHHLHEAQSLAAIMSHLHNTEDNPMDHLLAKGWLGVAELLRVMAHNVTRMAMRRLN